MGENVVEASVTLPVTPEALFDWHVREGAFERLTPPWERAEVVARSGPLAEGSTAEVRLAAGPLRIRWVAEHRDVRRGAGFVDVQREGPFRAWVHEHRMAAAPGGATLTERVRFRPPLGPLGQLGAGAIRRRVARMLRYRHALLRDDLAAHALARGRRLRIAVTGASGLVGSALVPFLTTGGHEVLRLVRRAPGAGEAHWDPARGTIDAAALEGVDAVIHLAGENIAGGRWTAARKAALRESRVRGTRLLAETLARLGRRPAVLVSASAVGCYGHRGDEVLSEASPLGEGFLADLARDWEGSAAPAAAAGIRVVHPRFGVVLSPAGGALGKMLLPFLLGLGGPLGDGSQWMSWLSVDDAVGMLHHALVTASLEGPFNAVAPAPVTSAQFAHGLGQVLRRPAILPVPALALRLLFGEMADATLLASQRCVPDRLEGHGYPFRHPTLEHALRHVLGR